MGTYIPSMQVTVKVKLYLAIYAKCPVEGPGPNRHTTKAAVIISTLCHLECSNNVIQRVP